MATRIDDNVGYVEESGKHKIVCNHCSQVISEDSRDYLSNLACYEAPVSMAGPQVNTKPEAYVDTQVVFRQYCCPNCFTAFSTQVVPANADTVQDQHHFGADEE